LHFPLEKAASFWKDSAVKNHQLHPFFVYFCKKEKKPKKMELNETHFPSMDEGFRIPLLPELLSRLRDCPDAERTLHLLPLLPASSPYR
jgi:hypothetical protein